MDKSLIYAILGIAETKDEEQIRQAYRTKLEENHPEDDPEGFKRLRSAYEQALAFAREPEEDAGEEWDDTPAGQWMRRVAQVYGCLSRRLDEAEWEKLLREDICQDLEYGEEVKWRLFRYLSEHFRLKSGIYRLLDRFFGIHENEGEFKEHLPVGFVDHMLYKSSDAGSDDFPYEWLTGEDTADYDQFLTHLYDLEEKSEEEEFAEAQQIAAAMAVSGIDHPYYAITRVRLTLHLADHTAQEEEDALEEAGKLMAAYPDSVKIHLLGGRELWDCGRKEEAARIFADVAQRFGSYYVSEKYLTIYEKEQGKIADALRRCCDACQNWNDEELEELRLELDEAYITVCEGALAEGTLTWEDAEPVCFSYLRTKRAQEGLDFLLAHPEYMENMKDVHKYLCLFYNHLDRFEDSIRESRLWREALLSREGEKELIARSYAYEGSSQRGLAQQAGDDRAPKDKYQAVRECFEQAITYLPEELRMRQELLDVLILQEAYEDAVTQADEILARDAGWFPALVQKQTACYKLGRSQDVVDLFYDAKEIYANYPPMYELTARLFIDYRQYGDAEAILAQAKEAEVESFGLDVIALSCERRKANSDVEYFEALKKALKLLEKFEAGDAKKRELAALYSEMAVLEDCQYYEEFMHPGKAEEYIAKAIELGSEDPTDDTVDYYYICGRIKQRAGKYEEAIPYFEKFVEDWGMTVPVATNLAACHNAVGAWEKAVECYEKALELDPENEDVNHEIAEIYRKTGYKKDSRPLYRKGLAYINRQIELTPDMAFAYRVREIIYEALGEIELADADADAAVRLDKDNSFGLNLKGSALYEQQKYQQALYYFKKAVANLDNPKVDGWNMYCNAADTCKKLGDFEQAEEWYRKGIELFEGDDLGRCYWAFVRLCRDMGRQEEALMLLEESYRKETITEETYLSRRLTVRSAFCRSHSQAVELEKEALETAKKIDSTSAWEELSDIQYYYVQDIDRAMETKRMVFARLEEENDWWENNGTLLEWMRICWENGDTDALGKYTEYFRQGIEAHYDVMTEQYPAMEQFLDDPYRDYQHRCMMVRYWVYNGQMDRAKDMITQLKTRRTCLNCGQCVCTEFLEAYAVYCEGIGDLEAAYRYYTECFEKSPSEDLSYYKSIQLGRKLGLVAEEQI